MHNNGQKLIAIGLPSDSGDMIRYDTWIKMWNQCSNKHMYKHYKCSDVCPTSVSSLWTAQFAGVSHPLLWPKVHSEH